MPLRAAQGVVEHWAGRRVLWLVLLLHVSTFLDDAIRMALDYEVQRQTFEVVCGASGNQEPVRVVSAICLHIVGFPAAMPYISVAWQLTGSILVLSRYLPQAGCLMLASWTVVQPFVYAQQGSPTFVFTSATVLGGILILLASEILRARLARDPRASAADLDRLLLAGRVLLVGLFFWKGVEQIASCLRTDFDSLPNTVLHCALLVLLALITGLVVIGLKVRRIALFLATALIASAPVSYPWFITCCGAKKWFMADVVMEGAWQGKYEIDASTAADQQRYYFWQRLAAAGGLLQLALFGGGAHSADTLLEERESLI